MIFVHREVRECQPFPHPREVFSPTLPPFAPRLDCDADCDALSIAHSLHASLVRAHESSLASDASTRCPLHVAAARTRRSPTLFLAFSTAVYAAVSAHGSHARDTGLWPHARGHTHALPRVVAASAHCCPCGACTRVARSRHRSVATRSWLHRSVATRSWPHVSHMRKPCVCCCPPPHKCAGGSALSQSYGARACGRTT